MINWLYKATLKTIAIVDLFHKFFDFMEEKSGHIVKGMTYIHNPLYPFLILILSSVTSLSFLVHNPMHYLIFDDSYITLKFASNFFRYHGITFDGTHYLVGATSPLHIIFVALLGLFFKMETASLVVGIVFFVFSSTLVYLWTFKIYKEKVIALLAGVLMSTNGWLIFDALNGLETTMFICLSILTFYLFYEYERKVFYTIPLFLSIFTRPEGWFIASALWLWLMVQYRVKKDPTFLRCLIHSLVIFILLTIPYCLLYFYYTGSIVTSTAYTKAIFFGEVGAPVIKKVISFVKSLFLFYKILLYDLPIVILPLIVFAKRILSITYLWFYYLIFYLFYFLLFPGAIAQYWCRYQHIFIPLLTMAICGGVYELLKKCRRKSLQSIMAVLIMISLIFNQTISFLNGEKTYSGATTCTRNVMIELALWLKYHTPPDSLIALHDIGAVGYFSDRKIVDLVGLTNPEITKYYLDKNHRRILPLNKREILEYLKEKRPNFLVMFPAWDKYFNFFSPDTQVHFEHIYSSPPLFPRGGGYKIFKCNWYD